MLQNYFFLNRLILELQPILKDSVIEEIFSQEKSKLIVVASKAGTVHYLELSVIPGNSYITLRQNFNRAKKNTVNFFEESLGQKIIDVEIASDDRVIKFNCSGSNLFFAIRGKFTNVFSFLQEGNNSSFKAVSDEILTDIKNEFDTKKFLREWSHLDIQLPNSDRELSDIRKKYPFLGSEIIKEFKARVNFSNNVKVKDLLYLILDEIKSTSPCVFINEAEQDVEVAFENFKNFSFDEKKVFDKLIDAVNFTLSKRYFLINKISKLKLIRTHLEREIKKVTSKINNLQVVLERGSKEEIYNKYGNLILANLGLIKSRMTSVTVEDIFESGSTINIDLNRALSPQKNAEYYFDKSRSEKISFKKNSSLLINAKKDFERLKKIEQSLEKKLSIKELDEIINMLRIKSPNDHSEKDDPGSKFKHYLIEEKYDLFVGKDSKNNDLLTTKFARQNDYWLHARAVSGSHAVLRTHSSKGAIPKNILRKAASIAAFHSRAKTAGVVPVAYTFKKYVVKKKGDPVGTVHLLREDVLLVKAEIPHGCEYVESER